MVKITDKNGKEFESLLGDFSVPDKDHLGWAPAETVFVSVLAADPITGFMPVAIADDAGETVIEWELGDIQATELIADFDSTDGAETDLNALLDSLIQLPESGQGEPDAHLGESNLLSSLDDAINGPQPVETSSSLIEATGLEFGGLTVIIDDDGTDTVAI